MINTQIKSHWRLAFRTLSKAIKITFSIIGESIRAKIYIIRNTDRLSEQRRETENNILASADEYWDRNL